MHGVLLTKPNVSLRGIAVRAHLQLRLPQIR
jgi:hypothetical protein